jgi:hypothetical protein
MNPLEPRLRVEVRKYDAEMIQGLASTILPGEKIHLRLCGVYGFHFQYHEIPSTPLTPLNGG